MRRHYNLAQMTFSSPLDRFDFFINNEDYSDEVVEPRVEKTPDTLGRTAQFTLPRVKDQWFEAGSDIAVGREIIVDVRGKRNPADLLRIFRGLVEIKTVPEQGGGRTIDVGCVDHTYPMTREKFRLSVNSRTFTRQLRLYFKDDNSGAGAPTQYVRRAELRVIDGGGDYIPFEDMDKVPLHSMRRSKAGERSKFITPDSYQTLYKRKEVVFSIAQVDKDDPTLALPNHYVSGTPNPPASTNDDWDFKAIADFFRNPQYPTRNIDANTIENVFLDVLTRDPNTDIGGCGYDATMFQLSYSYSKGAQVIIPDRLNEGMLVTAYTLGASTVTVSDGTAWAGKTSLTYKDTQGVEQTRTISGVVGDVITVTSAFTNLVAGMRLYGCDQIGRLVTLTGVGEDVEEFVNYTTVEVGGTKAHIREIRDATTFVIVNTDETDDFSWLGASGTLIYHTLEYIGLQLNRLTWDKERGAFKDFYEFCHRSDLLPVNCRLSHLPHINKIRLRRYTQYRGIVLGTPVYSAGPDTTEIVLDDVDGFYPLRNIVWRDDDGNWQEWDVVEVDYSAESITVSGDASAMGDGDYIYPNCWIIFRHTGAEHSLSLSDLFYRAELISTANQVFPVLDANTPSFTYAVPGTPHGGTWTIAGDADLLVDDNPDTMYLLRWVDTGPGNLEGDPEYWGMTPLPWPITRWDPGEDEYDSFVLQVGYPEDNLPTVRQIAGVDPPTELPLFTVEGTLDDPSDVDANWSPVSSKCVSRQFNPLQPNDPGSLKFPCDLMRRFRGVRITVDRPFFYKVKENIFGQPTRARDVPVVTFQLYRKPQIRYAAADETLSEDNLSPDDQITDHIGERPFACIVNKGGEIALIATLTLTVGSDHNFVDGDRVSFWDSSEGVPFTDSSEVTSHTATTITVSAKPAGLAVGDMVGDIRRWLLDPLGRWLDFYMPIADSQMFQFTKPPLVVEDETPQNGWDGQQLVALRLWEALSTIRDGRGYILHDPHIKEFDQVVNSNLFAPEMVMGISFNGFHMTIQTRQFNLTVEEVAVEEF